MCWQTENKACLFYVLGNALMCCFQASSSVNYRKRESVFPLFDRSKIRLDQSKIAGKEILQIFESG